MTDYDKLSRIRGEVDAFADEHREEDTDSSMRALCRRAGLDPDQFMIVASESSLAVVKALPAFNAAQAAFGQGFFMGADWQKQRKE